ncbi:MAG: DUF1559 domain-containing protein [Planctomycetota bacterium]
MRFQTMAAAAALVCSLRCLGAEHSAVERYITDDVAAIAYVNLEAIDLAALADMAEETGVTTPEQREGMTGQLLMATGMLDGFRGVGIERVYALLSPSAVQYQGPMLVAPLRSNGDANAAQAMLKGLMAMAGGDGEPPLKLAERDGVLLAGVHDDQVQQLLEAQGNRGAELVDAWKALGNGAAGLLVFGSKDTRRVVREMFPRLPEPFESLTGRLIADELKWGGIELALPPEPGLVLHVQAADSASADAVRSAAIVGLDYMRTAKELDSVLPSQEFRDEIAEALTPELRNKAVVLELSQQTGDLEKLVALAKPPVEAARASAYRATRINSLKHIGLAFLNHADARGHFPRPAMLSEDGRPLLSWRVRLLPYLDEQELYERFRHDEPWDSEHNFALISEMPYMYADPDPAHLRLAQSGRTMIVVPNGPETLFPGDQDLTFRDVKDGTSMTVLTTIVPPERSVIWTKPDDWEVDLANAWDYLRRSDLESQIFGFCDGSVQVIEEKSKLGQQLRKLLTRAGEEAVDY